MMQHARRRLQREGAWVAPMSASRRGPSAKAEREGLVSVSGSVVIAVQVRRDGIPDGE